MTTGDSGSGDILDTRGDADGPSSDPSRVLTEYEDLFRSAFEQAPIGAALVGPDLRFLFVNRRCQDMTGYTRDELLQLGLPDIAHPDDLPLRLEAVARLAAGEIDEYAHEQRFVRKDGSVGWVDMVVRPLRGPAGETPAYQVLVNDITERRRAEAAMLAGQERYRLLLENASDAVYVHEFTPDAPGRFLEVNDQACRMLGYTREEFLAMEVPGIAVQEHAERVPGIMAQIKATGCCVFETEHLAKDGRRIPVEVSVRRFDLQGRQTILSVARDITDRKHAEEALREDEARFRTALSAAHEGIVLQARDGRVLTWNASAEEVFGVSEPDIVGETALGRDWGALHEDGSPWPPEDHASIRTLTTGEPQSDVVMGVRRDGKTRWITVNTVPVFRRGEAEPSAVVISFADITARKQTERLMALPAEILAIIAAPDSVSESVQKIVAAVKRVTGLDAVGLRLRDSDDYPFAGADGYSDEFLEDEDSLAARLPGGGLCRDENGSISLECTCGLVIGGRTDPANPLFTPGGSAWTNDSLPFLDVPPSDDPRLNPRNRCIYTGFRSLALVPLRAGDEVIGLLHLADHHTGRFTPESIGFFEGLGASIGVALAHQRVLEELRESEKLHRSILKASPDDITVTTLDGKIRKVSTAGALMFGFESEEDVMGRSLAEFIVPEDREQARSAIELRLKGGAPGPSEYRALRTDGSTFPIEVNGDAIHDAEGRPTGMVFVVRDITERWRAEAEIRRLNEELQHRLVDRTEQLDSANQELESFAYAVSHDVRAPLRAIDGFSATVVQDEGDKLSEQSVSDLQRVRAAAQEMARLMDDLLGFTNVTHRDLLPRSVDLSALAGEVTDELAADQPHRRVEMTIEPGLVAGADAALLRVILRELLGNAWKFTSRHESAHVEVGALNADGERAFYVRDDGAGFDMRYAGHLFGLFQRLHPRGTFSGDGVGLATVQRLVRRHGGRVWAEAQVEQGATFFFTLPAAEPAA